MSSFEEKVKETEKGADFAKSRYKTPIVKYFWQASPLAGSKNTNIPKFLRNIKVLKHLSDYELFLYSKFLHIRSFKTGEIIFQEGDGGFGYYQILSGTVGIHLEEDDNAEEVQNHIGPLVKLNKYEYFGELSLLEDQNRRNASAIALEDTILLTMFKPDLEELISRYPVVGAKLLQGLSLIVVARLNNVSSELKYYKKKIEELEAYANKREN